MDSLFKDIRYGLRGLLKRPGFTAIALVALALGIGANTAIFSLVNAVILRPLPFPEPDQLVWVYGNIRNGGNRASVSPLDFLDYRNQNKTFEQFGASITTPLPVNLTGNGDPERLMASGVTGNYFDMFKVSPALGRGFTLENEKTGQDQVTVLSYAFWHKRFAGDPDIINKTIILDSKPFQVIGVMPAGLSLPQSAELWIPLTFDVNPEMKQRKAHFLRPIGRLNQESLCFRRKLTLIALPHNSNNSSPTAIPAGTFVCFHCASSLSAEHARLSSFSLAQSDSYCSLRVRMLRTCCWCEQLRGKKRLHFEPHSARVDCASFARCSPRVCCSRSSAARWERYWPFGELKCS
jgi:MacB-like periplasmic core domain